MASPLHIVFAGGGTAGHLHPGIAIAAEVKSRLPGVQITFVGGGRPVERHPVRAAGFQYVTIPSQPVPRNPFRAMRFITDNVAGYWASRWFLREHRVSLVVGLGGYASAATVRAATSRQIPTVLLEQNAVPSHVTRWLARSADMVCAGFDDVRAHFAPNVPLEITGNPARPAFVRCYHALRSGKPEMARKPCDQRRLIVIGGAGGARTLNEFMPTALSRLSDQLRGWQVVHQSGEGQLQETIGRYQAAGVEALVVSFIDEMASVMFQSDLVVCRASGTTIAELALAGVPAVLVPYPRDVEAYQLANADVAAAANAATVIDEAALEMTLDDAIVDHLDSLLTDDAQREAMAQSMRSLARPDAAIEVTESIRSILGAAATTSRRRAA